jgi:hypothetical protein
MEPGVCMRCVTVVHQCTNILFVPLTRYRHAIRCLLSLKLIGLP